MDTRNYDEPFNCGLEACDCREDNTCGCSFPNNISDMECLSKKTKQSTLTMESCQSTTNETHIQKDTICICSPKECDCKIERNEVSL